MAPEPIRVLLCCNIQYFQHCAVLLASLLEQNSKSSFEILVVTSAEPGSEERKLRRLTDKYDNCHLTCRVFQPPEDVYLPIHRHYTSDIYTRLWVADFFPAKDRVLYLDCDMVVVGDITELWQADLGTCTIGAVSIPGLNSCERLGIPGQFGFFNSGVMLIDLKKWRDGNAKDRLLAFIRQYGPTLISDQDALNACFYDDRTPLPYVWNVIAPFYFPASSHRLGLTPVQIAEITAHARIVHFNSASKPWMYMDSHPRKQDYYKYLGLTEWRDFKPADKTLRNRLWKNGSPWVPGALRRLTRAARRRSARIPARQTDARW